MDSSVLLYKKNGENGMQTVIMEQELTSFGKGYTSKGNQMKWCQNEAWYKADGFGYESLAESVVSRLLRCSTIGNFVSYEPVRIRYGEKEYRGCRSLNFKKEQEEIITLERLSRQYTGFGLAKELGRIADVKQRIQYTVELVETITGLENFGQYLCQMIEMDAFFLNEDRHTNNMAVLYDVGNGEYRLCPFFDMGLSLFADTKEAYPINQDYEMCRKKIVAKPFCRDFDEQLDAVNELYGYQLHFHRTLGELLQELNDLQEDYDAEEWKRVEETLRNQARKYQYMFNI